MGAASGAGVRPRETPLGKPSESRRPALAAPLFQKVEPGASEKEPAARTAQTGDGSPGLKGRVAVWSPAAAFLPGADNQLRPPDPLSSNPLHARLAKVDQRTDSTSFVNGFFPFILTQSLGYPRELEAALGPSAATAAGSRAANPANRTERHPALRRSNLRWLLSYGYEQKRPE